MQKIPTIFIRDESRSGHPVIDEVKPKCAWVLDGEGRATWKIDGQNVKIEGGVLYKRQKPKVADYDDASYVPCHRDDPSDRYLYQAFDALSHRTDGIYEAIGPKIQRNKHGVMGHRLVCVVPVEEFLWVTGVVDRCFTGLRECLLAHPQYEGLVFHRENGTFAKIKRRDFQLPW